MTESAEKTEFSAKDIPDPDQIIQELQRLRDELHASTQRSAKLELELDQLGYAISHDVRAPLRAINGFSAMLFEDYSDQLDDQGKRYLQVVRDNSRKLNDYIEALLELTRIGRRTLKPVDMDMKELFTAVCAEFSINDTDQRISFQIETLPPARGDRDMVRELLVELVGNAVKFTRSRTSPVITITGEIIGMESRYVVSDNGIGFDMQYAEKLFALFQKLHGPEYSEGNGVGLARVRRIVDRHGGRVWGEGRINEGARFSFTLPVGTAENRQG